MKDLLKFITCGSVDDGKSTLIGHMLYDAKLLFADQRQQLELDSKAGSAGGDLDYSLLLDGLAAEREQGITIDVAYRYFSTQKRSFIVADTPGHEEYTRNMAVGASFAQLSVILVDAEKGLQVQTRRHTRICALMGIRDFVFTINKMDLVGFDQGRYEDIRNEINRLMSEFQYSSLEIIPVSALLGDNLTTRSSRMHWYHGDTLLTQLETIDVYFSPENDGFCMPVQRVSRPDHSFRGFEGQIAAGHISVGDSVNVLPSRERANISQIFNTNKSVSTASEGDAVTLCLDKEVDISRGCVILNDMEYCQGTSLIVKILWLDDTPLEAGKNYLLKIGTKQIPATVLKILSKIDVNTGKEKKVRTIRKNQIARCEIHTNGALVFTLFSAQKTLGSLILIDRITNATSACGIVESDDSSSEDLTWQAMEITRSMREGLNGHRVKTLWFTGLSGAGKSTLANEIEKRLFAGGWHTMLLDGDNVRMGLNQGLDFSEDGRRENIRRVAEVAKLMNDAGLLVITSFISPYSRDRCEARSIIGDSFVEIYVNTSIEECERRDIKGLYRKARAGLIDNFTGISSPFELPETSEIVICTDGKTVLQTVDELMDKLQQYLI